MKGKKGSTDEGGVRSPLFVQWNGNIEAGRSISPIAGAIDLMPTLTGLTGISTVVEKPLDGKDLSPLILGAKTEGSPRTLFHHWNSRTSVRTQTYKLDHENKLFDMIQDRGQYKDLSDKLPEIRDSLINLKDSWLADVYSAGNNPKERPFTLGHADYDLTWLPARDGTPHGDILRSNRYPNASFFTNWVRFEDHLSWDVDVLTPGIYEAVVYYTAESDAIGSVIQLSLGNNVVVQTILKAHDPDLVGMENDRYPRIESYTKEFRSLVLGEIDLVGGRNNLELRALKKTGVKVIDVEGIQFRRISSLN